MGREAGGKLGGGGGGMPALASCLSISGVNEAGPNGKGGAGGRC